MVQPGRDSPGKEVKDTSLPPSPKWVFRPSNAKRKMKRSATPHPVKAVGFTKRNACVPLTETGRVRKKIVFEFEEITAGTNGGGSATTGKDGASSMPGEREKGRWKRKARPGPFEACTGVFEVVPGVLPLLAGELRFSMGQKEGSARHQPEVVAGTRTKGESPEVSRAKKTMTAEMADNLGAERHEEGRRSPELEQACFGEMPNALTQMGEKGSTPTRELKEPVCEEVAGTSPASASRNDDAPPKVMVLVNQQQVEGTRDHVNPCLDVGVACEEMDACDSDEVAGIPPATAPRSVLDQQPTVASTMHHMGPKLVGGVSCDVLETCDLQNEVQSKDTLHGEESVGTKVENDNLFSKATPCATYLHLEDGACKEDRAPMAQPPESSPDKRAPPESSPEKLVPPANVWKAARDPFNRGGTGPVEGTSNSNRKPEPIPLDAGKIKPLGTAGINEGTPSLSFSDLETDYLAEKLGLAIVGKFSHSLPSTSQIRKSLSGMGLVGAFTWKYLNAKHILLQFQEVADYAKVLNGPNGSPNWYVDIHPMRVFKWAPDFDTFFESPIVAVWCNILGIPAHLYEESALMAIGKLLGKPLQADHATIHQSRLSFARICVEIDISTPPPEEIILTIRGKDSRYKVAWDRIPLFCANCKHVGHVKEDCHASGRKARGGDKDRRAPPKENHASHATKIIRREWRPKADAWSGTSSTIGHLEKTKDCNNHAENAEGTSSVGPSKPRVASRSQPSVDEDGFQLVARKRKGKVHEGELHTKAPHVDDWHLKENVATVTFGNVKSGTKDSSFSYMSVACGPPNQEIEGHIEDLDPGGCVPCGGIPIAGLN